MEAQSLSAVDRDLYSRAFAHHRPTHAIANLSRIHVELREGAAQRVAMHAELGRRFALVALVVGKHFKDVALFELPYGIRVGNTGAVHLHDQGVKFALQRPTSLAAEYKKTTGESSLYTTPLAFI
jgi:hypothetical protein